jgi:hypothetical protein
VRLADERNSHLPSAKAHLACRMPNLLLSPTGRFSLGQN